jgi:NAD-reducing hydrogenase large subunit
VNEPLTSEKRDAMLAMIPDATEIALRTLLWFEAALDDYADEIDAFDTLRTMFMGLTNPLNELEMYDGSLRIIDANGRLVADGLNPANYQDYIAERVEPWTYLKSPFFKPLGYPDGVYRVGPLARLNLVRTCGTPRADEFLPKFRSLKTSSSFHYHFARLIEILYCFEKIDELLITPDILSSHVRAHAQPNSSEGVGMSEAPRGTLLHHYQIDENGLITRANLIIATGHNNYAMDRSVLDVARKFVHGARLSEPMLNRVEAVIRAYDPCLSCSTHAIGQMPLHIQLVTPDATVVDEIKR